MLLLYFLCTRQRYTVSYVVKLKCSIHGLYWQVQKHLKMGNKKKMGILLVFWYECAYSINSGNILELYLRWLDKISMKVYDPSVIVVHLEAAFLASWQMYFQYSVFSPYQLLREISDFSAAVHSAVFVAKKRHHEKTRTVPIKQLHLAKTDTLKLVICDRRSA